MPITGFHSEWLTIGDNRILLECRAGFPGHTERFIASVAAEFLNHNGSKHARVVSVFYDDKACSHFVTVASTAKSDEQLGEPLTHVLHSIFGNGNCQVAASIVPAGDEQSDHYDHMEHLSVSAGVAADRWKHADAQYQADVWSPR